eukprot:1181096-Rhodomonas_salina.3
MSTTRSGYPLPVRVHYAVSSTDIAHVATSGIVDTADREANIEMAKVLRHGSPPAYARPTQRPVLTSCIVLPRNWSLW